MRVRLAYCVCFVTTAVLCGTTLSAEPGWVLYEPVSLAQYDDTSGIAVNGRGEMGEIGTVKLTKGMTIVGSQNVQVGDGLNWEYDFVPPASTGKWDPIGQHEVSIWKGGVSQDAASIMIVEGGGSA